MADVLIKWEIWDTDRQIGRMSWEDKDRVWGNAAEAKDGQRLPANHQNSGESHGTDSHAQPAEGGNLLMA